jgi:hypothetical protein
MRRSASALAGLATLSLVLGGCIPIDPVHHLPPQVAPLGCDEIITFGARLPLPGQDKNKEGFLPGAEEQPVTDMDWQSDPRSDPVGLKLLEDLSQPLPQVEALSPDPRPLSGSILLLSGGSQQGAFGAGFMSAWEAQRGGTLPRFRMVTGISTGALQATFAFLGDTATIVKEYSIEAESDLLATLVKGKIEDNEIGTANSLWRRGTLARLDPLRKTLDGLITPKVLGTIAHEATKNKRTLQVAAVEMGSGEMAVFDLTKAAQIYVAEKKDNPARAAQIRGCYIEALLASSSVPMSAAPVFIDNRLYIDGGARFGVLVDLTAEAYKASLLKAQKENRDSGAPKNLFLIVNATLEVPRFCGLKKCPVREDGTTIPPQPGDPHPQWNFLQLAQRTVSVMTNQAYRSSVFIAQKQGKAEQFTTQFVRLDPAHLQFETAIDFPGAGTERNICYDWQLKDVEIDNPKEFYPRYMRCLIAYGKQHEQAGVFAAAEPR